MGKFKKVFAIISLITALTVVSACGGSGNTGGNNEPNPGTNANTEANKGEASSGAEVELVWSVWGGMPSDEENWGNMAKAVTAKYPNIKITLQMSDWNTYWTKLTTQVASGTAADIVTMQSLRAPGYAKNGLVPLKDYVSADSEIKLEDFNESIISGLSQEGELYALPYDFAPIVMYYNQDMFEKYGVPLPTEDMTWDQVVEAGKQMTNAAEKEYGVMIVPEIDYVLPFIFSNGGEIVTDDLKYNANNPEAVEAVQWVSDLLNTHKIAQPIVTGNHMVGQEQFASGKIGMYFSGPWDISYFKDQAKFKYGISTIPKGKKGSISWAAGSGFGISKNSKHPDEAYKAIAVLTDMANQEALAASGRAYPARISALPKFFGQEGLPPGADLLKKQASQPYLTTTTWQEANTLINSELEGILIGNSTAEQGMKNIQDQLLNLKDK
jgi:multiple sugar transport system substrate-binding protein